jgi:hypothetical protein
VLSVLRYTDSDYPFGIFKLFLTLPVPLVKQELFTLPEHMSSTPVFSGVHITRSLVVCVCFVYRCLSFCTFSFGHCVVCSSSIYGFWLPLWYLQSSLQMIKWQYKNYHTVCTVLQLIKAKLPHRLNSSTANQSKTYHIVWTVLQLIKAKLPHRLNSSTANQNKKYHIIWTVLQLIKAKLPHRLNSSTANQSKTTTPSKQFYS